MSVTRPRLLVVDDHCPLLELISSVLRTRGEVESATNGADALALLGEHHYSAVVCDMRMPDTTGLEVLEWVRQRRPGLERRFVMTCGDESDCCLPQGVRCLPKPFRIEQLLAVVDQVLAA